MKNFITSMLGALVALFVFTLGGLALLLLLVGAIATMTSQKAAKTVRLQPGSYLVVDLSTNINDAPPPFDFGPWGGSNAYGPLQLRQVVRALHAAATDSRISGILLKGTLAPRGYGSGYGAMREVRGALAAFRKSGKPVKAYLDFATTRDYYLASVANEITIDPYGIILMPGLAVEPVFFGGAAGKFGVGVQVTRVGRFKSYVEQYTREDMSPDNRTQTQLLLDDVWLDLKTEIGRSRGLTPAGIQAAADAEGLIRADAAKRAGLVDRVAYGDQVVEEIRAATGPGEARETFKQIPLSAYVRLAPPGGESAYGPAVAVVYAEGEIVEGEGDAGQVGGAAFARELRRIRSDDQVKAVVLRVNSPGGSVGASEAILRELRLIHQTKPVIVSMGSYAASGGYWISSEADRIFAEPTTITGSVGVFGIQFDVQRLFSNLGITFDRVKTGRFADIVTISRPKTDEEMAVFQRLVDWIYSEFVGRVADGRHLRRAYVEEIAQGRVWSGGQALRLGLVDEIGGLEAAIRYAGRQAHLEPGYRVTEYPRKKDLAEALAELMGKIPPEAMRTDSSLAGQIEQRMGGALESLRAFNDPQGVYARLPLEFDVR
jgi:protease-4